MAEHVFMMEISKKEFYEKVIPEYSDNAGIKKMLNTIIYERDTLNIKMFVNLI